MEKYAKLLAIFDRVQTIHSRTKAQKTLYVLKSLGFPVMEKYEYGNFGPYSQELTSELRSLVNSEFLSEMAVEGQDLEEEGAEAYQRYDLSITSRGQEFLRAFERQTPDFARAVEPMSDLAEELDQYRPADLELIATLMFLEDQGYPERNVVPTLKSLKPQFMDQEIEEALAIISNLRARFPRNG
jgi:uncharacterized protein YwgA